MEENQQNLEDQVPLQRYDVDDVFEEIDRGRLGKNRGISMGYPKLDNFTCGLQKGRYDLVFGLEKAGKSAFVYNSYIINPYIELLKVNKTKNLKVFLFSLEMSRVKVVAKMIVDKLRRDDNILIDTKIVLGQTDSILPDYIYEKIKKYKEYFKKMQEDTLTIVDESLNPTGIWKVVYQYSKENGVVENKKYIANNPDQVVIVIIDTAGNLKWEKVEGQASMKITIDKMSEYCRIFRNSFNYSPIMIMHANRNLGEYQREKDGDIFPKTSDIKESGQVSADINLCMCIFDPTPYFDRNIPLDGVINNKYDLKKIGKKLRVVGVLSNRDGECFVRVPMIMIGETGQFIELPRPEEKEQLERFYRRIEELKKLEI